MFDAIQTFKQTFASLQQNYKFFCRFACHFFQENFKNAHKQKEKKKFFFFCNFFSRKRKKQKTSEWAMAPASSKADEAVANMNDVVMEVCEFINAPSGTLESTHVNLLLHKAVKICAEAIGFRRQSWQAMRVHQKFLNGLVALEPKAPSQFASATISRLNSSKKRICCKLLRRTR
jgi:hypothetical protein